MGIKVKTKVNFNEIIEKLHKVAKDFAEKRNSDIVLNNIAFDEKGEFRGGGEYCVFMCKKDGKYVEEKDKKEFLSIAKEYITYFLGEEEANYIEQDDILPIKEGETSDDTSDARAAREEKENQEREQAEKNNNIKKNAIMGGMSGMGVGAVSESKQIIVNIRENKILNILFESDGEQDSEPQQNDGEESGEKQKGNGEKILGFGFMYDIMVNGKKNHDIADALKNSASGFFGGMLADLRNIKIKIGGEPVNLGYIFDPQKWKEKLGMKDIDINAIPSNVEKAFKADYPNTDINATSVKVWKKDELITHLNREHKITPEIKAKISTAEYSIVITVTSEDVVYPKYDKKTISKTVSKALGTTMNVVKDWNKVTEKDVIKIDNVQGLYKTKSNYEATGKPPKKDPENKDRDKDKDGGKPSKGKDVKESVEIGNDVNLILEDEYDETRFEDENNDFGDTELAFGNNEDDSKKDDKKDDKKESGEDNSLSALIQSQEYSNYINGQISEQSSKLLKSLGEDVETKYITNEECVKLLKDNDINNTEFVNQIRDMRENCLVTTLTKSIGKENLKESVDILGELLREYDIRHGKIISESEEKTPDNIEKETIKTQRITGDEKKDDEYQSWALNRIDVRQTIGNVQQEIQQKISTAYKNIFLNTQNKFKELKDVKLEFTAFQTSTPLDSEVKNESFNQHSELMKMLFEAEEAATRNDSDDEWIRSVSAKLTQEIYHLVKDGSSGEGEKKLEESEKNNNNLSKGVGSKGETVEQNGKTVKADGAWNLDDKWMHPYPTWYSPFKNMKSHVQDSSYYCIASYSERVQEFLTNHKITDGSQIDEKKFKYCALIIKKRDLMYSDNKHIMIFGGMANDKLKDDACQNILDKVAGKNNRIDMVHSTKQDGATIHNKSELLTVNLGFFNKKRCKVYSEVFNTPYPIPELDVWIRPFNKEDVEEPPEPPKPPKGEEGGNTNITINNFVNVIQQQQITQNTTINNVNFIVVGGGTGGDMIIPPSINIKMQFIFIMPDPIIIKIKVKPKPPEPKPTEDDKNDNDKDKKNSKVVKDYYIIVMSSKWGFLGARKARDMGNRGHEQSTDNKGVTTTHTSKSEYKPR